MVQFFLASGWLCFATVVGTKTLPPPVPVAGIQDETEPVPASLDDVYRQLSGRRRLQIARLHAYAANGVFPQNTDFPGRLVPYFVDRVGTACAVGHLLRLDGCEDLVNKIASACNHIRIENVDHGPLIDWIRNSGLTHDECASIQPSYATIEDYRRGREWQDEIARLRAHFAEVEQQLERQSQKSLGEALIAKVDVEIARGSSAAAFIPAVLVESLKSSEPNVRVAAAYALARLPSDSIGREARIMALTPYLADQDLLVRFWTAIALEKIGAASRHGAILVHHLTLPVFLNALEGERNDLRLPALLQLASIAPECIGTNMQLRILPEIRHSIVRACRDADEKLRESAQKLMATFRWQRIAYESQRMRRHYMSQSYELESLAAETLIMGRPFAESPPSVNELLARRSVYDVKESVLYLPKPRDAPSIPTAANEGQAKQIVSDFFGAVYSAAMKMDTPPPLQIESVKPDHNNSYFAVEAWQPDRKTGTKMVYVVLRPSMLSKATATPDYWFETIYAQNQYEWPASSPAAIRPRPGVELVLGDVARKDYKAFAATCDVFAYFLTYYARVIIDRDVQQSADAFTWLGRFASLRQYSPRFFELGGGGSSVTGGGGWDFHRFTLKCNRATGSLTLSAEPIVFPVKQAPSEVVAPAWATEELKLMGWRPFKSIDFFGKKLMPSEYCDVVESFEPANAGAARNSLYRRWWMEKSLPQPGLVLGLLFDQKGNRKESIHWIEQALNEARDDPGALADIARWEASVGRKDAAREHAEAALKLWPQHPVATDVFKSLENRQKAVKVRPETQ